MTTHPAYELLSQEYDEIVADRDAKHDQLVEAQNTIQKLQERFSLWESTSSDSDWELPAATSHEGAPRVVGRLRGVGLFKG